MECLEIKMKNPLKFTKRRKKSMKEGMLGNIEGIE